MNTPQNTNTAPQKRPSQRSPFGAAKKGRGGAPQKRRPPKSEYGRQLEEKQKAKRGYFLSEKQFSAYVKKASSKHGEDPKQYLYQLLESRLDSFVYRTGLSNFSRALARQIVTHGHITINGRKVNIPSYQVEKGDIVAIRPQSIDKPLFKNSFKTIVEEKIMPPSWISFDYKKGSGEFKGSPQMEKNEMLADFTSVLEFYSR
jgi:small subunit ribosomal protein S4